MTGSRSGPPAGVAPPLAAAYAAVLQVVRLLTGAALVTLVVVVLAAVGVRYFGILAGSLHWTDELARFTTVWLVMLGSVLAFDRGAHTAVDVLPGLLRGRERAFRIAVHGLSAIFLAVLAWQGLVLALRTMGQVSPALGLPMGYVYLAVPVGAALMAGQALLFAAGLEREHQVGDAAAP